MKVLKYITIIISVLILIIILFILVSYVNHKFQLSKEDKLFIPNGEMVEVNGHNIHVYTEGEGDEVLVFLSGGGTSSPVLDFKSLYSLLSDSYKIAVVEKAGYGFSEIVDIDRDIETILSETRESLSKAGVNGLYILCPHSMSGIEALFWAQTYPDEVMAIIGLDMAVPDAYQDYEINMPMLRLTSFAARAGITRWIPDIEESDAIKFGTLTEEEKELYRAIFYRRTATKTMINEVEHIKENAIKVKEKPMPEVPMLMFSSNGEGTGWDEDTWRNFQVEFTKKADNATLVNLNCPHYVHNYEYIKIADDIEEFLDN